MAKDSSTSPSEDDSTLEGFVSTNPRSSPRSLTMTLSFSSLRTTNTDPVCPTATEWVATSILVLETTTSDGTTSTFTAPPPTTSPSCCLTVMTYLAAFVRT